MAALISGLLPMAGLLPLEGGGFRSPGVEDFNTPPIFGDSPWVAWITKPMLQSILALVLILVFWLVMARKNQLVPSKGQFLGESAYNLVRNGIARDTIGPEFRRYVPLLLALFSFVLVSNLWGIFPLSLLPTASHVGWAYGLALMVWVIYNGVGIAQKGFFGYIRHTVAPSGVPPLMMILVVPLEFLSNIIIRPLTLALRLFGNMFSGHLLVLVFVTGGEYLLLHSEGFINRTAGGVSLLFSLVIFGLEAFVQCLQAYIFTILAAVYIQSSIAEEH